MRKIIASLAVTIMAGTHAASFTLNQYPSEHYYAPPLHKIQDRLAQGWGYGPRYFPRRDPWPPDDGPRYIPRAEPSPWDSPMDRDLRRYYRRRQFQHVQPFHPWGG